MATRSSLIRFALLGCLLLIPLSAGAQQIKPGTLIALDRDSVKTGLFHALRVNSDTGNVTMRNYIKRLADSVALLRAGQDYIIYRLYGALGSNASDSTNLTVGVNGVYEGILPNFNVRAFNFALLSTTPSNITATFRQDLPPLRSDDSTFILRVSRNVSMTDTCAVSIYKVPVATGMDVNDRTAGTFYDMVRFSGLKLPGGANRFITIDLAVIRRP